MIYLRFSVGGESLWAADVRRASISSKGIETYVSTSVLSCTCNQKSAFISPLFFGAHKERCVMMTGNCGACGLPRDASCFFFFWGGGGEYINRN